VTAGQIETLTTDQLAAVIYAATDDRLFNQLMRTLVLRLDHEDFMRLVAHYRTEKPPRFPKLENPHKAELVQNPTKGEPR
jgi:hypothetical protein